MVSLDLLSTEHITPQNAKGPKCLFGGLLAQTIDVFTIIETLHSTFQVLVPLWEIGVVRATGGGPELSEADTALMPTPLRRNEGIYRRSSYILNSLILYTPL